MENPILPFTITLFCGLLLFVGVHYLIRFFQRRASRQDSPPLQLVPTGIAAPAQKLSTTSDIVVSRIPSRLLRLVLGFRSVEKDIIDNADHSVVHLVAQPQVPFKPKEIRLSGVLLHECVVTDIKIGRNSMLPSSDGIPAHFFEGGLELDLDTVQVGQDISISIGWNPGSDKTGLPQVKAAMVGLAIG